MMPARASLEQIRRFGDVAAVLREAIIRKGLRQKDIRQQLNAPTGTISGWFGAKTSIPTQYRSQLAQLLDVPVEKLQPKPRDPSVPLKNYAAPAPPKRLGQPPKAKEPDMLPLETVSPTTRSRDVLTFAIDSDGMARINLSVSLPVDKAMPLMRLLMDAGVVASGET